MLEYHTIPKRERDKLARDRDRERGNGGRGRQREEAYRETEKETDRQRRRSSSEADDISLFQKTIISLSHKFGKFRLGYMASVEALLPEHIIGVWGHSPTLHTLLQSLGLRPHCMLGPSIYDVNTEGVRGVRLRWTHVEGGVVKPHVDVHTEI